MDTTTIALLALSFNTLVAIGGWVWAASRMSSKVGHLDNTIRELKDVISDLVAKQATHDTEIAVLKDRVDRSPHIRRSGT